MTQGSTVSVPGRVNLIGEHIDYHGLPVLPMAIQRRVTITFQTRNDAGVRITSQAYGQREFSLADRLTPNGAGDWGNYLKAGAQAVQTKWKLARGMDATVTSDLPPAAGLSSSSALMTGVAIALLKSNGICPTISELMEVLPEGEYFVGTRGGAMDHAAVLAGRTGCALRVGFAPLELTAVPIPPGWAFLVAHSLKRAEKSGSVLQEYNARKAAGLDALRQSGFPSYRAAVEAGAESNSNAFRHVISETRRVDEAVMALRTNDFAKFGDLLNASHASLRDRLQVSTPELDLLVEIALNAGAEGARLTGAGFGGCIIALCKADQTECIRERIIRRYHGQRSGFDSENDIFVAEPSAGALVG